MPDKPKVTPKDFFLWAGAMITLYASAFAFLALIFSYLDYAMPDALTYYSGDPYMSGVSYEMASLIVLFPIFLVISRLIHRDIEKDPTRGGVWVRRWALYLTLFAAGATIAGDLITLIMYFFNGDVTLRFILKVLVVFLVAGGGFLHFLADLRGYWTREPMRARTVGSATGFLVVITIVAGFFVIGTPRQARLWRLDEQRINDLQQLQAQVLEYYQRKGSLPAKIGDLEDPLTGFVLPKDPATGNGYEYDIQPENTWPNGEPTFQLCSDFSTVNLHPESTYPTRPVAAPGYAGSDNWPHNAVRTCFVRPIDPGLFPQYAKPAPKP